MRGARVGSCGLAELPPRARPFAGRDAPEWLGVPLISTRDVIGALVVQIYSADVSYSDRDKLLLQFVSAQMAAWVSASNSGSAAVSSTANACSLATRSRSLDGHAAGVAIEPILSVPGQTADPA